MTFIRSLALLLVLGGLLAACGPARTPEATALPTPVSWTSTPSVSATAPRPSPTALPAAWVVVQPDDASPAARAWAEGTRAWAAEAGLRWVVVSDLDAAAAQAPVAALVALPPIAASDAVGWAVMHPQARVLAWAPNAAALPPVENIPPNATVVVAEPLTWEQRFFLAGYATALAAPNWRAGLLYTSPPGYAAEQIAAAFARGARYWCGPCVPAYPPMVAYPFAVEVPPGVTEAAAWRAAAEQLLTKAPLEAVYLRGEGAEAALPVFREQGVTVLWDGAPNPDADVTLYADPWGGLDAAWAASWLAGEAEPVLWPRWQVQARDAAVFSPGRVRLVQDLVLALRAGLVDPTVTP